MKAALLAAAIASYATATALGQGQFVFNNRVPPDINARFVYACDPPGQSSIGTGYTIELFNGTIPLDPASTTFRGPAGSAKAGYVVPTVETVAGVAAGANALITIRLVDPDGARLDFGPFSVTLGGGTIVPPNLPLGTLPLTINFLIPCPEPYSLILSLIAVAAVLLHIRPSQQRRLQDAALALTPEKR